MCFSLEWIKDILIYIIIVSAVIALLQLLLRFLLPRLAFNADVINFIASALRIVMWAIVCIAAVVFIFGLIACLAPGLPRVR